jgi:hypothetical protein
MKPILQPKVSVLSSLGGEGKDLLAAADSFGAWAEVLIGWNLRMGDIVSVYSIYGKVLEGREKANLLIPEGL